MTNEAILKLTDVELLHLVGREETLQDLSTIDLKDKTVLITGSAGSIGSRLAKVVLQNFKVKQLVCVDWWENGMFYLQDELKEFKNVVYKIADVKNETRIDKIMSKYAPNVVFHASAYKHVPLMEDNPTEAFTNNVGGILNMAKLSILYGVEDFVLVSTDKAVNSTNVMGATKRIAEILIGQMTHEGTSFKIVRFGNVIQSNGSVIKTFKKQILDGKKLTVTHKDVIRYFMTIEEAVHLIIKTLEVGVSGNIFLLDMGNPVRIMELAEKLDALREKPMGIDIIGLRKGEKLKEELDFDDTKMDRTVNEKMFLVRDYFDGSAFVDWATKVLQLIDDGLIEETELIKMLKDYDLICVQT